MTSISKLLGYPVEVEAVTEALLDSFSTTLELKHKGELDKCLAMLDVLSG